MIKKVPQIEILCLQSETHEVRTFMRFIFSILDFQTV